MALLPSARSKPFDRFTQGRAQLALNVQDRGAQVLGSRSHRSDF